MVNCNNIQITFIIVYMYANLVFADDPGTQDNFHGQFFHELNDCILAFHLEVTQKS